MWVRAGKPGAFPLLVENGLASECGNDKDAIASISNDL
jgi:hypothetical protein